MIINVYQKCLGGDTNPLPAYLRFPSQSQFSTQNPFQPLCRALNYYSFFPYFYFSLPSLDFFFLICLLKLQCFFYLRNICH